MSFLKTVNYQPVVDTLVKLGNQLNKPAYRFLKGEVIALAMEKVTDGRLEYVDEEGYDCIDKVTGDKYELKSVTDMFKDDVIVGRVSLANTNKDVFKKTFDYLLCIQSNPNKFAIAQLTWEYCNQNYEKKDGQFNLAKGVIATDWICKDSTTVNTFEPVNLNVRKLLESVL